MKKLKSNKQRRTEIKIHRAKRAEKAVAVSVKPSVPQQPVGSCPCNPDLLAPYNSYGVPEFVERGYYRDREFQCRDCQKIEVWTAAQQKWWYEVAKGHVESYAIRCRACRKIVRERKMASRNIHGQAIAS